MCLLVSTTNITPVCDLKFYLDKKPECLNLLDFNDKLQTRVLTQDKKKISKKQDTLLVTK